MTSLSAELADAKQRAREERRQLSVELASTRTEAAAAAERAGEGKAALADAQGVIEDLTARLRRHGPTLSLYCFVMSCYGHWPAGLESHVNQS